MNEWKELEIDNLPSDIKLSDRVQDCGYEIEFLLNNEEWERTHQSEWWTIIKGIAEGENRYRYRKPEPKAPSHEEIMTKWWLCPNEHWYKVVLFDPINNEYRFSVGRANQKSFFTGLQSATIPLESKK